jgi:hypothetical protein
MIGPVGSNATAAPPSRVAKNHGAVRRRALAVWPRLDAGALRRAGEDVDRVATLVERRSSLPRESIIGILRMPDVTEDEAATWFG